jgi:hypothetical protein
VKIWVELSYDYVFGFSMELGRWIAEMMLKEFLDL